MLPCSGREEEPREEQGDEDSVRRLDSASRKRSSLTIVRCLKATWNFTGSPGQTLNWLIFILKGVELAYLRVVWESRDTLWCSHCDATLGRPLPFLHFQPELVSASKNRRGFYWNWTPLKHECKFSAPSEHLVEFLQPMGEFLRYVMQLFLRLLILPSLVRQGSFHAVLGQPARKYTASIITPPSHSYTLATLAVHYLGLLLYLWCVRVSSCLFVAHTSSSSKSGGEREVAGLPSCRLR